MPKTIMRRSMRRTFTALGVAAAALSVGTVTAGAGTCPAGKVVADGFGQKAGA